MTTFSGPNSPKSNKVSRLVGRACSKFAIPTMGCAVAKSVANAIYWTDSRCEFNRVGVKQDPLKKKETEIF